MIERLTVPILLATLAAGVGPAKADPALLIHGNYCGPGSNAPLPPVDALDAACARHDACWPATGLPPQACNLRLQRDAARIARDPREPDDLRAAANVIALAASVMPYAPPVATAMGETPRPHATAVPLRSVHRTAHLILAPED
ncbi:hypothetical protein MKK67_18950 [Methylobacterium sp. J-072]|uniref:hypothetical protein n=1 Tax=Methylobacterium sp. J-072 TaxID=2836651 RepID=UPI001FBA854F|nr:hypothetical protein [Methylobacterium sp. J-072]MCJ2094554.1 hypothetical protein [Methylobacterium sp. J-072]